MNLTKVVIAGLAASILLGCSGGTDPSAQNYTKDAFKKTPPPPGWADAAKKSTGGPSSAPPKSDSTEKPAGK